MQETVDFLHDLYKKQPAVQVSRSERIEGVLVEQPAPCRLRFTENEMQLFVLSAGGTRLRHRVWQTVIALDSSDPLSVSVLTNPGSPIFYQVDVKQAMGVSYFVPLPVHEDRPVLDLTAEEPTGLNGYVLTASPTEIVFIAQDENRYRLPTSMRKATVTRNGGPAQWKDAQPGDAVDYQPLNAKGKHDPVVAFKEAGAHAVGQQFKDLKLPVLGDEQTANRVAKALIHAMVLCHAEEKPSPF